MRILFDHGTPAPLRSFLPGHTVWEAKAQGWDAFKNGDLLVAAEASARAIAIVVLGNAQWPVLRLHVALVVAAVDAATPGSFTQVDIPAA